MNESVCCTDLQDLFSSINLSLLPKYITCGGTKTYKQHNLSLWIIQQTNSTSAAHKNSGLTWIYIGVTEY